MKHEEILLKQKRQQSLTQSLKKSDNKSLKIVKAQRLLWVDALRGLAIVLMIIFHFCYDMHYFGWVDWNIPNGPSWSPLRYLIISLSTFTVGLSLVLADQRQTLQQTFIKRMVQLLSGAACVTVMSLFLFPRAWIYFGILHFIVVGSLISIVFVKTPKLALGVGRAVLVGFWLSVLNSNWPFKFFYHLLPRYTEDLVPLFPWLGVMLIGTGLGGLLPIDKYDLPKNSITKPLANVGRHGLTIYLIHQPLLFGGFILVQVLR